MGSVHGDIHSGTISEAMSTEGCARRDELPEGMRDGPVTVGEWQAVAIRPGPGHAWDGTQLPAGTVLASVHLVRHRCGHEWLHHVPGAAVIGPLAACPACRLSGLLEPEHRLTSRACH